MAAFRAVGGVRFRRKGSTQTSCIPGTALTVYVAGKRFPLCGAGSFGATRMDFEGRLGSFIRYNAVASITGSGMPKAARR